MDEKGLGILKRYSSEINVIQYELQLLKDCRVYEISRAQSDGYLNTRATKLEEKIKDLLYKIEYDKEGIAEKFAKHSALNGQ
jgi:hypothetical protein